MNRLDYKSAQCKLCGIDTKFIKCNTSDLINHIFKDHQKEAQTVRNYYLQLKVDEFDSEELNSREINCDTKELPLTLNNSEIPEGLKNVKIINFHPITVQEQ